MHDVITISAPGDKSIRDLAPKGRVICWFRDGWRLRATWDLVPDAGEPIEFVPIAGDREEFRTVLAIAAVAASFATAGSSLATAAPYLQAAALAYNLLVPPSTPDAGPEAKDVFSASVAGNTARLDQPIPRICGVDMVTPPFAALPYTEFRDDDVDNVDNEQYFYAVLAVSYGPVDLLADFLGNTPVSHYQDVLVHRLLQPGEQPTIALANVYTSPDVSGFELDPKTSAGSYVACPEDKTVSFVGVDVIAPGLGLINDDGDHFDVTVKWIVQAREINAAGTPVGNFRTLPGGVESRRMFTNTTQRWSGKYPVSPPARVEVRVIRTNEVITGANARDSIQWVGLRGYSSEPAPLDPNTSHYELVLRASKQLSPANQTSIRLLAQGKARTWSPGGGWSCAIGAWGSYVATRNPAWWEADLWSDPNWGEGLPDERIDLDGLYDFSLTCADRQDRFDYTFTETTDAWSASQLIARAGRARVFRRNGVRTLRRDELAELGETMFSARICRKGTEMTMVEKLPQRSDPDGIVVQYRSNVTWDTATIECPCPGRTVRNEEDPRYDPALPKMTQPVYKDYVGIQGYTHALREGLYDAADLALRARTVEFQTEMEAKLRSVLAPVYWQPQIPGYGQTGDVAFWDADTLVVGLSEPADFSRTPVYLTLRRDDGSSTEPVPVSPGPTANDVRLPAPPDFDLILDDGLRERPVFLLGPMSSVEIVKIASISDAGRGANGAPFYSVTAVIDDPRVHAADNAYLPGPGDDQDPIGIPGDYAGGTGGTEIVVLDDRYFVFGASVSGGATTWTLTLRNNGSATVYDDEYGTAYDLLHQWVTTAIETSTAALYEVFLAPANAGLDAIFTGDPVRTWLNLGTTRTWTFGAGDLSIDRVDVPIDVSIRLASDGSLQTTARFTVKLQIADLH